MSTSNTIKRTQEQATAAWIDFLNRLRIKELIDRIAAQDGCLEKAMEELQKLKDFIGDPEHILGSESTKHGEIAEHAQVNISNARKLIKGCKAEYSFDGVGRTAPEDYLRGNTQIQSKFYNGDSGGNTFRAITEHLKKYPDFVKNGGEYEVPKDQYENIMKAMSKPSSQRSRAEETLVKKIKEWEKETGISFKDKVKPAVVDYKDVQQGNIHDTVEREEESIKETDQKRRQQAQEKAKPSIKEGAKASAISAGIEGGVAFCMAVAHKRKEKKLGDFTAEDWKEVGIDTGKATATGGIRGGTIYVMTNFTPVPAPVASSLVSAVVGVAGELEALHTGRITQEEFLANSETLCLELAVSTVAAMLGSAFIPTAIIGSVIGNTIGMMLYDMMKELGEETKILDEYIKDLNIHNSQLEKKYRDFIQNLRDQYNKFSSMLELALSENVNVAFSASIDLSRFVGVEESKILDSISKIDAFFMA